MLHHKNSIQKSQNILSNNVGRMCGILYILIMGIGIPLLIYLDPDYSTDLQNFDPLSKLSQTASSKSFYRLIHISSGIFALMYFELHFFRQRKIYWNLNNWRLSKFSARAGSMGQIATGIFVRDMFPLHLFAAAFFATGYVSCIVFIIFNLDNQLHSKKKLRVLIAYGYLASLLALMNAFNFRYSSIRGIYQFLIIIVGLSWYIYEAILYPKTFNHLTANLVKKPEISKINPVSYIMLGLGIYLIIFGYLLFSFPNVWPWKCNENDETCQLPNVLSLMIAGIILISYSLSYQLKIRRRV